MEVNEAKEKFVQSWGSFGSAWGINKTMAQIHALLLTASDPLSTEDVMDYLKISRGNANMNLRALMDWGLVSKESKLGERKEFFLADKDVWNIARNIVRERRKKEIEPMIKVLEELKGVEGKDEETEAFRNLMEEIDQFADKADGMLDKFQRSDEHWFYKSLLKLLK